MRTDLEKRLSSNNRDAPEARRGTLPKTCKPFSHEHSVLVDTGCGCVCGPLVCVVSSRFQRLSCGGVVFTSTALDEFRNG